jgi:hypothetical protein
MTWPQTQTGYPVQFSVDYPDRPLNRLTTAFRIFLVIPIAIVLSTVSGYLVYSAPTHAYGSPTSRRSPAACSSGPRCS